MPAFKTSAVRILAGLAASALFAPVICAAAQVKVNDEAPLDLQSPPGFTYTNGGSSATLSVATNGFMACANVAAEGQSMVTNINVVPQHGQWRFPGAIDIRSVGYGSGTLSIGRNAQGTIGSALACHASGAEGEILEPLSDGLMQSGFDSKMVEQFTNLVNWVPGQGFSWSAPDWTQVPTDPCTPSASQPARAAEDVSCGAAVGALPAAAGASVRAPTIWTATDSVNFYYVVRVDARWGLPTGGIQDTGPVLPDTTRQPQTLNATEYKLVEAYSRGVVGVGGGYLGDTGQWCVLGSLPTTLTASVCANAPSSGTLNGPFVSAYAANNFPIVVGAPPSSSRLSFYMAFIRPIVGAPPPVNEPAVEISMLIDPTVGSVGGDRFKGDDVAFGFLPVSLGFPWMHGGQ
jgi:hypothetical protein